MSILLGHLDGPLGTVATGVDLGRPLNAEDHGAVRAALADRLLVVFPDQHLDLDAERRFAASLGPLWHHPGAAGARGVASAVLDSRRTPGGARPASVWHADATFAAVSPAFTILSAQVVPHHGGATSFANQQAAWRRVDDRRRDRWRRCGPSTSTGRQQCQRARWLTGATHRLVPVDRPALAVREPGIHPPLREPQPGRPPARAALPQLALHPTVRWDHHWSAGDLVVWDNRALLHRAHHDFGDEARVMTRVTVAARAR